MTVVTVFFARPALLRWQHASLVRHLKRPFRLIVVDNALISGRRSDSVRARGICAELGAEVLTVERDASLESRAGAPVFRRFPLWRTQVIDASASHAYALTFAWRQLARSGLLNTDMCILDSDAFLAEDVDPAGLLSTHELAFVPQTLGQGEYMWPGCVWLAGEHMVELDGIEWWPNTGRGVSGDTGACTAHFLAMHPELRVLHLRTKRLSDAPTDLERAPEEIFIGGGDQTLAIHFRAGSGWDHASRVVNERKARLVLERVAWRRDVTADLDD